ncbi:MAG: 2,3,4,5-tetrahydropyridine-2,6-dicarboxylate N-succinyltransferase [Myxococcota bacterium]|nr:2,3,4,5-tetrahydropyridine-2,6-dicarboxylate N-succinyltransferase [Myxococcota bacterium]
MELLQKIDAFFEQPASELGEDAREVFATFLDEIEAGRLRAASPDGNGGWVVEPAVKRGILLGFRLGSIQEMSVGNLTFSDKSTYPPQKIDVEGRNIRIVPGGNSVRRGAYLAKNVTMMPPAFVNVGAYVGEGTMVDSHALVGSCAQIGAHVHLSAGVQIGGVLEPIGQTPVIIEDNAMIGGMCGVFEGVRVGAGAVLGSGVILTASTPVYDMVNETVLRATPESPLCIPANAVVIPGSRPAKGEWARANGLMMAAPLIIKYRDEKTDGRTALEEALR